MNFLKSIAIRFSMWISGSPRIQLPNGQQLPDSWLADCVSDNRRPVELAAQAAESHQSPMPNLRQCEPWRAAPISSRSIGMAAGRGEQPWNPDVEPRAQPVTGPSPAGTRIPTRARSIVLRTTKTGA